MCLQDILYNAYCQHNFNFYIFFSHFVYFSNIKNINNIFIIIPIYIFTELLL